MNEKKLEKKIEKDIVRVKKEIGTLAEDSRNRLSEFVNELGLTTNQAKKDISSQVEEEISHFEANVEKFAQKAKSNVVEAAATAKKEVEHGLGIYNAKAQRIADKVPGHIGEKAAQYPWVAVTVALGLGVLVSNLVSRTLTFRHRFQTR